MDPEPAVGTFPCGASWGISTHHRYVHACAIRIAYVPEGQAFAARPHPGDHVCRCGDRREPGKTPR